MIQLKPRRSRYRHVELYAVHNEVVYTDDGEILALGDFLDERLADFPRALCIAKETPLLAKRLAERYADDPRFNARLRLARRIRTSHRNTNKRVSYETVLFNFFGFYESERKRSGYAIRHLILDPDTFLSLPKHARPYVPVNGPDLLTFGRVLREWCRVQGIPFSTTGVSIASSLIRDPRFLPDPVRKVPRPTNEKARKALTGHSFYVKERQAVYPSLYRLDQRRSHHACARDLTFPHPDTLHARGYFRTLTDRPWSSLNRLRNHHGLLYVRLHVEHPSPFYENMETTGSHLAYVTTNELAYLQRERVRVEYVVAAWTSSAVHDSLNRYARFALDELRNPDPSSDWWLKPLLLAPYGLLGVNVARPYVIADTSPNGGVPQKWHAGRGEAITVYPVTANAARHEPAFTNVVARAMIETESKCRTAEKAHALQSDGWEVLSVDADAILFRFDGDRPPPESCERWKASRLDDVIVDGPLLISNQVVKLPGITGTYRERFIATRRRLSEPVQERMPL